MINSAAVIKENYKGYEVIKILNYEYSLVLLNNIK